MTCMLDPVVITDVALVDDVVADVAAVPCLEPDRVEPTVLMQERVAHSTRRANARRMVTGLTAVILVSEMVFVAPRLGAMGSALTHPHWGWMSLAVLSEAISMLAFALLQQRLLRVGGVAVSMRRMMPVTLGANALSVTLPAGPLLSTGYTFGRLRRFGASAALATWSLLYGGVLSMVAFSALMIVAAVFAGATGTSAWVVATGLVASAVALGALGLFLRRPRLLVRMVAVPLRRVSRLLRTSPAASIAWLDHTAMQTAAIRPLARDRRVGLLFATLNWTGDLGCFVLSCYAVGITGLSLKLALVAYVAGMAASGIPLLPGGGGGIEAALVLTLVRGGVDAPQAAAGVLVYRLISFILVASVGWGVLALGRAASYRQRQSGERAKARPITVS